MTTSAAETEEKTPHLDEGLSLSPEFVRAVVEALDTQDGARVRELVQPLHAADFADLLGLVRPQERDAIIAVMGEDLDPEVLIELEDDVRDDVLDQIEPAVIAEAVTTLDSDDAIYLLEDLETDRQQEILEQLPRKDRAAVELGLQYPEYSAGRLMQRDVVAVPPFWTVGQVIDYLRKTDSLPEAFFEIFVVDPGLHPVGTIPTSRLMRKKRSVPVEEIMDKQQHLIAADTGQEEVAYLFQQYHLISTAVVDNDNRLVGMITVDDIVEVIQEENEEDVLALGGVGDESLTDSVLETTRHRFSWLFVNLITAVLASIVISLFEQSIEKVVALAILMPIVASMGGNAGTQSLTVAVRALATRDLTPTNAARIVWRECLVGGLNGVLFAVLMGGLAAFWFASPVLGFVVGVAMIINLAMAGFSGILVPLSLQRMGADPALASTVFVTTVTDVVGFFVFLGLASIVLVS